MQICEKLTRSKIIITIMIIIITIIMEIEMKYKYMDLAKELNTL